MEEARSTTQRQNRVPSIALLDLKFDPPLSACIIEDPAASSIHDAVIAVAETHLQGKPIARTGPSLAKAISFPGQRGSLAEPRFKSEAFTEFHRRCQLTAGPAPAPLQTSGKAAVGTWQEPLVDQLRPQTSSTISGTFSTASSTVRTQTAATTPSPDHSHIRSKTGRGKRISHQELHRTSSGSASSNISRVKRGSLVASSPTKNTSKNKMAFFESGKWKGGKKDRTGLESGLVRSMSMLGFRNRGKRTEKDENKRVKDQRGETAITTKIALKRSSRMIGATGVEDILSKKEATGRMGGAQTVGIDENMGQGIQNGSSGHLNDNVTRRQQDDFREFFFFNDQDDSSESSSSSRCSTSVHPCSRGNIDNNYSNNNIWYPSSTLATSTIPIPPKSPRRHYICSEGKELRSLPSPTRRGQRVSWAYPPHPLPLRLTPAIPRWKRPLPPSPPRPQQARQQQQWDRDSFKRAKLSPSHSSHATALTNATAVVAADDTRMNEDGTEEGRRWHSRRDGSDGFCADGDDEDDAEEEEEGGDEVFVALAQEVTFRRPVIVQHGSSFCNAGGGGISGIGGGGSNSATCLKGSSSAVLDPGRHSEACQ